MLFLKIELKKSSLMIFMKNENLKEPNIYLCKFSRVKNYMNIHRYYSKRHYQNKRGKLFNIFDSLFSIRKIGYTIELIQNDISEILKPNLKKEDFEKLIEEALQPKTEIEIPDNWKILLSLNNIYPAFGLNNLLEDNCTEQFLGMVKLHKNY